MPVGERPDLGVRVSPVAEGAGAEGSPATETAGTWRERRVQGAQQDVYRLLQFATEHSHQIPADVLRKAVDIARLAPSRMSEEQEEALWQTRTQLSEVVAPAHAPGLHLMDLLEADTPATIEPRTLRGWSGRWLLITMLTVAAVHIYTVVGRQLTTDAAAQLLEGGGLIDRARTALSPDAATTGPPVGQLSSPATPPPRPISPEELENQIVKASVVLEAQRGRLAAWNSAWRFWNGASRLLGGGSPPKSAHADASLVAVPFDPPPAPPGDDSPATATNRVRASVRRFMTQSLPALEAERYAADVAQAPLMTYVLPMLYGALGAFVFVVRLVTNDIDRGSLRMLLRIRYRMRLMLGAIFGLSISMLTTQASPLMKEIPVGAVGLAFFAGYGIDVVFGLLDALIGRVRRFGAEQLGSTPPAGPAAPSTSARATA